MIRVNVGRLQTDRIRRAELEHSMLSRIVDSAAWITLTIVLVCY